ncbi:hypothetical protein ACFX5K_03790 [Rickettsiales bacterium LUAb2]
MKKINLLFTALLILISSSVYATTNKYYEIDFTYTNVINGKPYTEEAVLLRDKTWLQENKINKAGDALILNIPEFGVINAKATAKEVRLTTLNPEISYTNNQSMVMGTFKHYSTDVREYKLKDSKTSITQTIQATPNHAFYVQNRTAYNKVLNKQSHFIEIQNITPKDHMLNESGDSVTLVCDNNICGKQLVSNNKPIAVYNLEIFKQHQYLVVSNNQYKNSNKFNININNAVLVHNICSGVAGSSGGGDDPFRRPVDPQARIGGISGENASFYPIDDKFGIRVDISEKVPLPELRRRANTFSSLNNDYPPAQVIPVGEVVDSLNNLDIDPEVLRDRDYVTVMPIIRGKTIGTINELKDARELARLNKAIREGKLEKSLEDMGSKRISHGDLANPNNTMFDADNEARPFHFIDTDNVRDMTTTNLRNDILDLQSAIDDLSDVEEHNLFGGQFGRR